MELVVEKENVHYVFSALTTAWMLHIAAGGEGDCEGHFEVARSRLNLEGGLAKEMLIEPPAAGGLMDELDEWHERLGQTRELIPGLEDFRALMKPDRHSDLVAVSLHYLLSDSLPDSSAGILAALADQAGGRPS